MKRIPLTRGLFALVDDADFEWLNQWKWHAQKYSRKCYAVRHDPADHAKVIIMHRLIMDAPDGLQVDHINHDGVDNRRSNLRLCTRSQNAMNERPQRNRSSRFRGVSLFKRNGKWRARIRVSGELLWLGNWELEKDAARAYNEAAKKHFGEFAFLNPV